MSLIKYKDKEIVVHAYNGIKRNDCYTQKLGWSLKMNIMQNMEEICLKSLYRVWVHLNDIPENTKL